MKKITLCFALIAIGLLLSNCAGIRYLSIETREPARIVLPANVSTIIVVNNVVQQPDDIGHNRTRIGRTAWERETASSDSIAIFFTEALAQFLGEEEYFERVLYFHDPIRTDQDFFVERTLSPEKMGEIMRLSGADAIVSLDRLLMQTDITEHFRTEGFLYCDIIARIQSVIRVYMPTMEGQIPVIHYSDSLRWQGFDLAGRIAYTDAVLPTREEAMKELAIRAAEKMTNTLSPHWRTQERWFYTSPNARMREGASFAQRNQWENARESWETVFNSRRRGTEKAKAANNIALAYEILDNIERAHEWATIAHRLFEESTAPNSLERRRSLLYKNELERRLRSSANQLDMTN
jgi:hypothetical protein